MDDERQIDIETKLAYQEQALMELGQVLTDQQAQISRMASQLVALQERLASLSEGNSHTTEADERPPHY